MMVDIGLKFYSVPSRPSPDLEVNVTDLELEIIDLVKVLHPSQPIRVMLSWSVYLTTLFLGRLSPLGG